MTGNATVYLNGCLICRNFSSYTEFEADITDYVSFEEENVVAVYVDTTPIEGWWYGGGRDIQARSPHKDLKAVR